MNNKRQEREMILKIRIGSVLMLSVCIFTNLFPKPIMPSLERLRKKVDSLASMPTQSLKDLIKKQADGALDGKKNSI